ncbi:MAG: DUF1893 domain-containing protein [Spirochaetota bacterium]|nr:DUF1893 domain-containing protein [Spirochaetota bacterium]
MTNYSLELKFENKTIFSSNGKWLLPLFDLEVFLKIENCDLTKLTLYDKIIGKASALMIIRLGIKNVEGGIVSKPAETAFKKWGIKYSIKTSVELIDCKTEILLSDVFDPEIVYHIIKKRAGV